MSTRRCRTPWGCLSLAWVAAADSEKRRYHVAAAEYEKNGDYSALSLLKSMLRYQDDVTLPL